MSLLRLRLIHKTADEAQQSNYWWVEANMMAEGSPWATANFTADFFASNLSLLHALDHRYLRWEGRWYDSTDLHILTMPLEGEIGLLSGVGKIPDLTVLPELCVRLNAVAAGRRPRVHYNGFVPSVFLTSLVNLDLAAIAAWGAWCALVQPLTRCVSLVHGTVDEWSTYEVDPELTTLNKRRRPLRVPSGGPF